MTERPWEDDSLAEARQQLLKMLEAGLITAEEYAEANSALTRRMSQTGDTDSSKEKPRRGDAARPDSQPPEAD